jgi:hypothetical protein
MRKLHLPLLAALGGLPALAHAAPKPCSDPLRAWEAETRNVEAANRKAKAGQQMPLPKLVLDGSHLDCLRDDVLIINGETPSNLLTDLPEVPPGPMVACTMNKEDPKKRDCVIDYSRAVKRALDVIGPVPNTQWDQIVVLGQDMSAAEASTAPLFFREGYFIDDAGKVFPDAGGVNEVDNIGLPPTAAPGSKRRPNRPYVGYIAAGGTDQAARWMAPSGEGVLGKLQREDPTGPLAPYLTCANTNPGLCFLGFHNFFDALAQATGAMFGPYLRGPKDGGQDRTKHPLAPLNVTPVSKPSLGSVNTAFDFTAANARYHFLRPRIWNSLLDLKGSLMGGNNFRDNGNGTFESTRPSPYYGVNVPFAAGWKPGTVISGTRLLRFHPLDLYVMGLLPIEQLPQTIRSFVTQAPEDVVKPELAVKAFNAAAGPMMGMRAGMALRPSTLVATTPIMDEITLKTFDILGASGGERSPGFAAAPHAIKQLWVVVSKPVAEIEMGAATEDEKLLKQATALQHLDVAINWRHEFANYFYMLTGYRGRVITTYDGLDDNPYFEFGQPTDDAQSFQADDGVRAAFPGHEPVSAITAEIKNVMRVNASPGGDAGFTYTGKPFPLRISGNQTANRVPINSIAVRMRVPPGMPKGAVATVILTDGPSLRLPSSCNGRSGCKESSFLVADGKWHTYTANLGSNAGFVDKSFTGFKFIPSDKSFDFGEDGIEVDYIRAAYLPSAADTDQIRLACTACATLTDGEAKKKCDTLCKGKGGSDTAVVEQGDGFLDSEDNCPATYNPLQEDGDGNGIGDACEDFDGDGVVNSWDNCPVLSNSRQRDQDGDGEGDVCDSSRGNGCFLKPESLGGPMGNAPGALVVVFGAGLAGLIAFRRRRR